MSSAQPNRVSAAIKLAKAYLGVEYLGVVLDTVLCGRQGFFTIPDGVTKIIRFATMIVPARK
jgi:hypothetical protein